MCILACVLSAVVMLSVSCQTDRLPAEYRSIPIPEERLETVEAIEHGESLYRANCVWCHGELATGQGARTDLSPPPADLSNAISWEQPTPRWVFYVIREGRSHSAMLGFKDKLSVDETWDIVAFVASFSDVEDE